MPFHLVGSLLLVIYLLLVGFSNSTYAATPSKSLQTSSTEINELLIKGRKLVSSKRFEEAIIVLKKVNKESPGNVEILYLLARAYEEIGDLEKAKLYLEEAIKLSPKQIGLKSDLSRLYYKTNNYEKSVSLLREQLALSDNKTLRKSILKDLYKVIARQLVEAKEYRLAIDHIETSTLLFPDDYKAFQQLGRVYTDVGFWEEAETSFSIAKEKSPYKTEIDVDFLKMIKKEIK